MVFQNGGFTCKHRKGGSSFQRCWFWIPEGKKDMFDTLIYNNFMKYFGGYRWLYLPISKLEIHMSLISYVKTQIFVLKKMLLVKKKNLQSISSDRGHQGVDGQLNKQLFPLFFTKYSPQINGAAGQPAHTQG